MRYASLAVPLFLSALLAPLVPLAAQQPDQPAVEALRQQVMERLLQTYRNQAGLTPEQDRRFRDQFRRAMDQRHEIQQKEQALWRALDGQMRPGVAADPDSLNKLLDGITAQRSELVDLTRNEQREYAQYLTPVQRAQLALMWERFQRQVEQITRRRMEQRGPGRLPRDTIP
jgi:hypothetical protein